MSVWMLGDNPYMPILGVVGDVSEGSVRDTAQPTIFYNHRGHDRDGDDAGRSSGSRRVAGQAGGGGPAGDRPEPRGHEGANVRRRRGRKPRARAPERAGVGQLRPERAAAVVARVSTPARVPGHRADEGDWHSHRARRAAVAPGRIRCRRRHAPGRPRRGHRRGAVARASAHVRRAAVRRVAVRRPHLRRCPWIAWGRGDGRHLHPRPPARRERSSRRSDARCQV